jgi:heme-degrading monooxygenase HmoA
VPAATIDWSRHSELTFRIDSFVVPDAAREEFTAAMHRNLAFIRALEGFRGHLVFEKRAGDAAFNLVTIAAWDNREAIERAGKEVRAHYQRIGFDMPGALKRWGVTMTRADYEAPLALQ